MSTILAHALRLAGMGFHVFPVRADDTKRPMHKGWQAEATTQPTPQLFDGDCNVGIFCGASRLLVVDVDNKNGKCGDDTLLSLELTGKEFPATFEQRTPTGGRHLVYRVVEPVKQGANVLGAGLDIRSRGGYIVGSGSRIDGRAYTDNGAAVVDAPAWLVAACGGHGVHAGGAVQAAQGDDVGDRVGRGNLPADSGSVFSNADPARADARARNYLATEAPKGEAGSRNETAYRVATRIRDFGVDEPACLAVMHEGWECDPMLDDGELEHVVHSAYSYAKDAPGNADPAQQFLPVPGATGEVGEGVGADPVSALNNDYALVIAGGGHHILHETTDEDGTYVIEHWSVATLHAWHAADVIDFGKGKVPITEQWMKWPGRRSYRGLVFKPEQKARKGYYNFWRGFSVQPTLTPHAAVDAYLGHLHDNVCQGDDGLFSWLMSWLAHLTQRPWEKPHVAIVLRGGKGVGKNVAVESIGALLGQHFLLTADPRYLVGNFNGHLEHCLLLALDEAFWSGDKRTEGVLKNLVTGKNHVIEHKGKEPYKIANLTRVAILGNEEWLVPASHDERRYAVFDVGDGRRQDRDFFAGLANGLRDGGYGCLLGHLRNYRISSDVNAAPATQALADQKHASLDVAGQWWFACLQEGRLLGHDFTGAWESVAPCETVRNAFRRYTKERVGNRVRLPDDYGFGRMLKHMVPALGKARGSKAEGQPYCFKLGTLEACRKAWEERMGASVEWGE